MGIYILYIYGFYLRKHAVVSHLALGGDADVPVDVSKQMNSKKKNELTTLVVALRNETLVPSSSAETSVATVFAVASLLYTSFSSSSILSAALFLDASYIYISAPARV